MIKDFIVTCSLICLLSILGYFFAATIIECLRPRVVVKGVEFVNPVWWYKNYRVNYFGAAMAALGFTLLCPIPALGYWFYKLCTVGRR